MPIHVLSFMSFLLFAPPQQPPVPIVAPPHEHSAVEQRIARDMEYLTSPELKGRGNGYPELDQATDYLAKQYKALGILTKIQRFPFVHRIERTEGRLAIMQGDLGPSLTWGRDVEALGFSADADLKRVPVVFAGLGMSVPGYDDLAGIDVKDKAVLIARTLPELAAFRGIPSTERSLYGRIQKLRSAGAAAILVLENEAPRPLVKEEGPSNVGLPVLSLRPSALDIPCGNLKASLGRIAVTGQPESKRYDQAPGLWMDLSLKLRRVEAQLPNLVALIPGRDPKLKAEYIVLGAHMDHLGLGERHSRAGAAAKGKVHPGADDNASGTAEILELSRRLAKQRARRSILVIHFSGEEEGILGSTHWIQHPTVPLPSVKFMVNMDMVGRMDKDKPTLQLGGLGAPKSAVERAKSLAPKEISLGSDLGFSVGGSDHMSFGAAKIPTFFFFTGIHADYHMPTDTLDRINTKGMVLLANYGERILRDLADGDEVPSFDPETAKVPAMRREGTPMRIAFGIIPDFTENPKGFRISGVSANSTAEATGLQSGDIICAFGEKTIGNIYDYMGALSFYNPGDKVTVKWIREGKEMQMEVILKAR